MKIIVAGGRHFNNYQLLKLKLNAIISGVVGVEIVSGGAKGADALGERYAREHNIPLTIIHANWDKYGKAAGPKRNEVMANYADALVVFWDGNSRGTANMIQLAKQYNLPTRIIKYA